MYSSTALRSATARTRKACHCPARPGEFGRPASARTLHEARQRGHGGAELGRSGLVVRGAAWVSGPSRRCTPTGVQGPALAQLELGHEGDGEAPASRWWQHRSGTRVRPACGPILGLSFACEESSNFPCATPAATAAVQVSLDLILRDFGEIAPMIVRGLHDHPEIVGVVAEPTVGRHPMRKERQPLAQLSR